MSPPPACTAITAAQSSRETSGGTFALVRSFTVRSGAYAVGGVVHAYTNLLNKGNLMRKTRILLLAAAATAVFAAPALAASFQRVGAIDVGYHADRDNSSVDFGGSVERLQFVARGGDVQCKYIRARFGNGRTRDLFSGRLRQNASQTVDLPGDARNVQRIISNCHGFSRGGASIDVYADVGQYAQTWRNNPTWARLWAGFFASMFPQPSRPNYDKDVNYWVPITTVRFSGYGDRDSDAAGFAGKSITRIALRPDANAKCTRVSALFGNGVHRDLVGNFGNLYRGQTTQIDLPGGERNLVRLALRCHPVNTYTVNIQVLGRK
jgi:hypothetical protein